jgi:hypothetical protein
MGRRRDVRFLLIATNPNKRLCHHTARPYAVKTLILHFVVAARGTVLPSSTAIADISGFMK